MVPAGEVAILTSEKENRSGFPQKMKTEGARRRADFSKELIHKQHIAFTWTLMAIAGQRQPDHKIYQKIVVMWKVRHSIPLNPDIMRRFYPGIVRLVRKFGIKITLFRLALDGASRHGGRGVKGERRARRKPRSRHSDDRRSAPATISPRLVEEQQPTSSFAPF